jgi:hypothetical protein
MVDSNHASLVKFISLFNSILPDLESELGWQAREGRESRRHFGRNSEDT